MAYFRCYNCWTLFKSDSKDDYDECPKCGKLLFVGSVEEMIEATITNPREKQKYEKILKKLKKELSNNKDIYEDSLETIAGMSSRHKPDAIYYYLSDKNKKFPLIYEVETCDSIFNNNTINQCRLFSQTAKNTSGEFFIVVPKICNGKRGFDLAYEMLEENVINLDYAEIKTF